MNTTTLRPAVALLALAFVACQPGTNTHPVPSVAQIGSDLHCAAGDHGYEDNQAGWGFCYPATWQYIVRAQSISQSELDLTFDIADSPCASPPPVAGNATARPACTPGVILFAFMIISTYARGDSANLAAWVQANLTPPQPTPTPLASPTLQPSPTPRPSPAPLSLVPLQWGNSSEAALMPDGRRIALTPHHVVILDLRSGTLNLEAEMSKRLGTWKFAY